MGKIKQIKSSIRYKDWKEFTKNGKLFGLQQISNELVQNSWLRCLEHNLDPLGGAIPEVLPKIELDQIIKRNEMLVRAAESSLFSLKKSITKISNSLILCDAAGNILYQSGKGAVSDFFKSVNLVVGGNCCEKFVGTTAPGIALIEKKPAIVLQEEHYRKIYHWGCCIATPIFDIENKLAGVINTTILPNKINKIDFLYDLTISNSRSIQTSLHTLQTLEKADEILEIVGSELDSNQNGIFIIGKNGKILFTNEIVSNLFQIPTYKLIGQHYQNIFESEAVVACLSASKQSEQIARLKNIDSTGYKYFAKATPLYSKKREFVGSAIRISSQKKQSIITQAISPQAIFRSNTIIGFSPAIERAVKIGTRFAHSNMPILLQGATGTGKEVFARAIHNHSPKKNGPFLPINCSTIPTELLESELFGYCKGAFTGALPEGRMGKFEIADGGTLFLDEIDSLPINAQAKLLRVVEEGEFMRLGGHNYCPLDVRLISASNSDIKKSIKGGCFRKDLFYRISTVSIYLPPLKERLEDLDLLVHYFLEKYAKHHNKKIPCIDLKVRQKFYDYNWPGNIRELENCIKFSSYICDSELMTIEHLPDYLLEDSFAHEAGQNLDKPIHLYEKSVILKALEEADGNIGKAASYLNMSRSTIYRKRKLYGLV